MLTYEGIRITFLAWNEPRRATAGGTTRTPVARSSASLMPVYLVATLSKKARSPDCMTWLSFRRNDSSTAFLTHWFTCHWPTAWRSATRRRPVSRSARTLSTASRTSPWVAALMVARFSHAVSMMFCSCWVMALQRLGKGGDAVGGFEAFVDLGHQRKPDASGAGVDTVCLARQKAAGQHRDI